MTTVPSLRRARIRKPLVALWPTSISFVPGPASDGEHVHAPPASPPVFVAFTRMRRAGFGARIVVVVQETLRLRAIDRRREQHAVGGQPFGIIAHEQLARCEPRERVVLDRDARRAVDGDVVRRRGSAPARRSTVRLSVGEIARARRSHPAARRCARRAAASPRASRLATAASRTNAADAGSPVTRSGDRRRRSCRPRTRRAPATSRVTPRPSVDGDGRRADGDAGDVERALRLIDDRRSRSFGSATVAVIVPAALLTRASTVRAGLDRRRGRDRRRSAAASAWAASGRASASGAGDLGGLGRYRRASAGAAAARLVAAGAGPAPGGLPAAAPD